MASKQKTVGIRVPGHPICKLLLETLGNPIVNTSAQLADDDDAPAEPYQIELYLGNRIDLIIDGGPIFPDPSSVIDLTERLSRNPSCRQRRCYSVSLISDSFNDLLIVK